MATRRKKSKTKTEKTEEKSSSVETSSEEVESEGLAVSTVTTGNLSDLPAGIQEALLSGSALPSGAMEAMEEAATSVEVVEEPVEEEPAAPVLPPQVRADLAKDGLTEDMLELIAMLEGFRDSDKTDLLLAHRRRVRYRLFRIREGGKVAEKHDRGLKAFIEKQFEPGMNWNTFTFTWDVAPNNPLMLIPERIINYDWIALGGQFKNDKKYPPAFTNQG